MVGVTAYRAPTYAQVCPAMGPPAPSPSALDGFIANNVIINKYFNFSIESDDHSARHLVWPAKSLSELRTNFSTELLKFCRIV